MSSNAGLEQTAQAALTNQAALRDAGASLPLSLHCPFLFLTYCECCMQGQGHASCVHHISAVFGASFVSDTWYECH